MNKTTARATLTQMLSIVFHRMEAFDQRAREEAQAALHAMEETLSSPTKSKGRKTGGSAEAEEESAAPPPPPVASPLETNGVILEEDMDASNKAGAMPCGEYMYPAVYVKLGYIPQVSKHTPLHRARFFCC